MLRVTVKPTAIFLWISARLPIYALVRALQTSRFDTLLCLSDTDLLSLDLKIKIIDCIVTNVSVATKCIHIYKQFRNV